MDARLLVVAYLMICILSVAPSPYRSRSKNRNSAPTYDQKQSGDYNIQLHLKDFEIVALLSDSVFGSNGDYDYNYDYSELTIKPGLFPPTTTSKPSTSQATPTSQPTAASETTSAGSEQSASQIPEKSTAKPEQTTKVLATEIKPSEKPESVVSTTEKVTNLQIIDGGSSSTRLDTELEVNVTKDEPPKQTLVTSEIIVKPAEYMGIIDRDQMNQEESLPLVVHRKCASGFTRDKQGRCRRVRRPAPQFSFGISRLATLASKLRQTNDAQPSNLASNETTE